MFKNVAAKFYVFAFDATTNVPKTGDAANITAYVAKDYGAVTVLGDTSAVEQDATNAPGYYMFDAAQAETNADILLITGKSATANIKVIGAPAVIFTRPTTGWLAPTTAGRTLDVSAGGEAGVDWANVGSPTTSLALTGTTIATTQKVDIETVKTNPVVNGGTITFPTNATLASTTNITAGTITTATNVTTVNGLAAGVITAASIAADAITDAKVAADVTIASVTGSVGSVTGAVGSVTGNVGGNVVGTIGGLTAAALKDFFDTDSTTTFASAVAGSVVKEIADNAGGSALTEAGIADAVWDEARSGHVAAGSFGEGVKLAPVYTGTAEAGSNTTITLPAGTRSAVDDFYRGFGVYARGGTGAGQATRIVTGYVGATGVATFAPTLATAFDNTTVFEMSAAVTSGLIGATDYANSADVVTINDNISALASDHAATDADVTLIKTKTDQLAFSTANRVDAQVIGMGANTLTASALDAGAVTEIQSGLSTHSAADVWAVVLDGTRTAAQLARGWTAALLGKANGLATTNAKYRNISDTKDVIDATVDADGNRSSVTLDLS